MIQITEKKWNPEEGLYIYEAIADDIADAESLPVAKGIGSSVICPDGIYFYFPSLEWKKLAK